MKYHAGFILTALNAAAFSASLSGSVSAAAQPADCECPDASGLAAPSSRDVPFDRDLRGTTQKTGPLRGAYFIATNGNDAWSGRLADPNTDKSDGPFATLERARDAIRKDRAARLPTTRFAVYFRSGRYRIPRPVVFGADDFGIDIAAFPGEHPELAGSVTVSDWRPRSAGEFTAISPVDVESEIFVAGERQRLSVQPGAAGGWRPATAGNSAESFSFDSGGIGADAVDNGTRIELRDEQQSRNAFTRIGTVDLARHVATLLPQPDDPIANIGAFRLLGKAAWIREKGEFGADHAGRQITLLPRHSRALLKFGAQVPVSSSVIVFRGAHDNSIVGLTLEETKTTAAGNLENAAIVLENATRNVISGDRFGNVGQAIRLTGSSKNLIVRNLMSDLGGGGIELQDASDKNAILNNTLRSTGRIVQGSAAIYLHAANGNRIANNTISDVPRHGIGIDNWDDATINVGNVVEYNRLQNLNQETFDSGAIEMLGRSAVDTKTVIRYNDIKDAGPVTPAPEARKSTVASGIYLDDLTTGVLVCGNRIIGAPLASIQVHGGSKITVRDNFAILDRPGSAFMFMQSAPPKSGGTRFDFNRTDSSPKPASALHRVEFRFDNDAVIAGEDRDLFLSEIDIGSHRIKPEDGTGRYVVDDGRTLPSQTALPWNGTMIWEIAMPDLSAGAAIPIFLRAWSNTAGGIGGHFILKIDGTIIGDGIAPGLQDQMTANVVTHNIVYATAPGERYFKDVQAGQPAIAGNGYLDLTGQRSPTLLPMADTDPVMLDRESLERDAAHLRMSVGSTLKAYAANLPACATKPCKSATSERAVR